ncbi:MAG: hypothetical protein BWK76_01175 [Desulfobulbaceae bacterium A2]|nr:MAG: hypothetical protein BWK76_01175 [Desulfobulbaceae bacterium A2]
MKPIVEQLAEELRGIYDQDQAGAPAAIESFLHAYLQGFDAQVKRQIVTALLDCFPVPAEDEVRQGSPEERAVLARFCSLILGRPLAAEELSSEETLTRLSESLNTLFNTLNELVGNIRATLFMQEGVNETIRHVIGSSLVGAEAGVSLSQFLGEINAAFLVSHKASGAATTKIIDRILQELDPARCAEEAQSHFLLKSKNKANQFDQYAQVYANCRNWHTSGRSAAEYAKLFEKECQDISKKIRR